MLIKSDGSPWRPLIHVEDICRDFIVSLDAPQKLVHNRAFNVGRTKENYRIRDLAQIVKEAVPRCSIEYAADTGPNERCYRVNFGLIELVTSATSHNRDRIALARMLEDNAVNRRGVFFGVWGRRTLGSVLPHPLTRKHKAAVESPSQMKAPLITILCPVFNEERVIPLFFERIQPVLGKLSEHYVVHLVFLNNASRDRSTQQIEKIRAVWPSTYLITMSRNVGYHASLEFGLRNVTGDLFVFIDVDCEDPPEMILEFVEKHEQGCDIVYGERVDRDESAVIKKARKFFYRLLHAVADDEIILDMAEFSLFTREVRDAVLDENTSYPFLRASIARVGFFRAAIPFKRQRRIAGNTHYNLIQMSLFAVGGILSASTLLLRLPIYLLPFWILALLGLSVGYISTHSPWLALTAFMLFAAYIGGTVAFSALYVARTYRNGLQRPNAFIDRKRSILQPISPDADAPTESARSRQPWVVGAH